jgi:hypothetical protein
MAASLEGNRAFGGNRLGADEQGFAVRAPA